MAMFERPLKEIKTDCRAHTLRRIAAKERSDARAQQRLSWATFVRTFDGPVTTCREALMAAMVKGDVPMPFMKAGQTLDDATVTVTTLFVWRNMPESRMQIEALRKPNTGGRPRAQWHTVIQQEFELQISGGRFKAPQHMLDYLSAFAKENKITTQLPTLEQVRWRMGDVPFVRRLVARHGKRAGIADAIVHGSVPAEYAHQVWVLDELDLPVLVRAYDWDARALVAIKPVVVVVVDGASGVVVSYYVVNPLARGRLRGCDRWDVMAALVSGMFTELAPPACRRYAGWMPEVLRYDRAEAHGEAGARLRKLNVHVPKLPGFAPWHRGLVESVVKHVKAGVRLFRGHKDFYSVAEHASRDDLTTLEAAVRNGERLATHIPVLIEDLLTIEQLSVQLDGVIRAFNEDKDHDEFDMPRAARYGLTMEADRLRPGRDAISLLEPHRIKVQKRGIVVNRIAFEAATPAVQFFVGARADLRLDPALRGVFAADDEGHLHFMRPMREAARTTNAAEVAIAINRIVSAYDMETRAAKQIIREREIGPEQAEIADAVADAQLDVGSMIEALHRLPPALSKRTRKASAAEPQDDAGNATSTPVKKRKTSKRRGKNVGSVATQSTASSPSPRTAPPAPITTMPAIPGVVPITQAPSHGRPPATPPGTAAWAPVARRGIIRSFS